jgi:hypothetical protein
MLGVDPSPTSAADDDGELIPLAEEKLVRFPAVFAARPVRSNDQRQRCDSVRLSADDNGQASTVGFH